MAAVEARVAGRRVAIDVEAGPEDVASGGADEDGRCAKKSVNFLLLSLRERFAGIFQLEGRCNEPTRSCQELDA